MSSAIPPALAPLVALGDALFEAAEALVASGAEAAAQNRKARRKQAGETLRPGALTPLWNVLAGEVRAELKGYGAQARLARLLGVHRQTVNAWLTTRTRMPDAERTLQLMAWLVARKQGQDPA